MFNIIDPNISKGEKKLRDQNHQDRTSLRKNDKDPCTKYLGNKGINQMVIDEELPD